MYCPYVKLTVFQTESPQSPRASKTRRVLNRLTKLQPLLMLARSTNAYSVIVIQMYIFLSQAALEYFDCSLYDDGEYRLDAQPTIKCYDGDWLRYLPLGIFAIILHVVFVPMVW